MDIADPFSPTPPSPHPILMPKSTNIPPPKPAEVYPFLFLSTPPQPTFSPINPSKTEVPRERKKPKDPSAPESQWLQHLNNINNSNNNPLGWLEAIGSLTQILKMGINNITSTHPS